jgi:hypothetical protein
MATEKELLQELEVAAREVQEARLAVKIAKRAALDAETQFINAKLTQERIQERYRIFKNQQVRVSQETVDDDKELERFRQLLPELLKRV